MPSDNYQDLTAEQLDALADSPRSGDDDSDGSLDVFDLLSHPNLSQATAQKLAYSHPIDTWDVIHGIKGIIPPNSPLKTPELQDKLHDKLSGSGLRDWVAAAPELPNLSPQKLHDEWGKIRAANQGPATDLIKVIKYAQHPNLSPETLKSIWDWAKNHPVNTDPDIHYPPVSEIGKSIIEDRKNVPKELVSDIIAHNRSYVPTGKNVDDDHQKQIFEKFKANGYKGLNSNFAIRNLAQTARSPELLNEIHAYSMDNALTKHLAMQFADNPNTPASVLKSLHETNPDHDHLLDHQNIDPDYVKQLAAGGHPYALEKIRDIDPDSHLAQYIADLPTKKQSLLKQHHFGSVEVAHGTSKLRSLRDKILEMDPVKGELSPKQLGSGPFNNSWGPLQEKNGNISASKIQAHIDAQPKTKFNFGHELWEGAQRHANHRQLVFKLNVTTDQVQKLRDAGVYSSFKKISNSSRESGHPVDDNHTIGWVRYENHSVGLPSNHRSTINSWSATGKPAAIHVDEIQTDHGPNTISKFKENPARARQLGIDPDKLDKMHEILFNNKHPSEVLMDAFKQYHRDLGNHDIPIHTLDAQTKAPISGMDPKQEIPGHMKFTYSQLPKKSGAVPSQYGQTDQQNSDKVPKGAPTWTDKVRKSETPKEVAYIAAFNASGFLLFGKRNDNGKWTLPGGHLEAGESPEEAAVRELDEEAGIEGTDFEYLGSDFGGLDNSIEIHCFKCSVGVSEPDGSLDPDEECTEWRWVDPEEIPNEIMENLHSPKNITLQLLGLQPLAKSIPHFVERNPTAGHGIKIPKSGTPARNDWDKAIHQATVDSFANGDHSRVRLIKVPTDISGTNSIVNKSRFKLYQRMLQSNDVPPPVVVRQNGKSYHLLDGNHRLEAARQAGLTHFHALEVLDPPLKKSEDPLETMLRHPSPNERIMALKSKACTPFHLRLALQDEDPKVRAAAAKHPKLTPALIEEALSHPDVHTREAALSRPDLQEQHLEHAMWDPELTAMAARHPALTEDQRERLLASNSTPTGLKGELSKNVGYLLYPKLGQDTLPTAPMVRAPEAHDKLAAAAGAKTKTHGFIRYNAQRTPLPENQAYMAASVKGGRDASAHLASTGHESQHSVFSALKQKYGLDAGHRIVATTLSILSPEEHKHLKDLTDWKIQNRYDPIKEPEERITHLQNYLQDQNFRNQSHKANGIVDNVEAQRDHHTKAKQIWQKLRNQALTLSPEAVGVKAKGVYTPKLLKSWVDSHLNTGSVLEDSLGGSSKNHKYLEAAAFLSGHTPDEEVFRQALVSDESIEDAALKSVGMHPSEDNYKALQAVMEVQHFTLNKSHSDHKVEALMPDGHEVAEKIQEAYTHSRVEPIALGGKHSKGALKAEDPKNHKIWILKPGSGKNSPALGTNQEKATQSRREAAFYHVARAFGLENRVPRVDLLLVDGHEVAAIELLPADYRNLEQLKEKEPSAPRKHLEHYRQSGELHKWAILDAILGNSDRNAGNIMVELAERHPGVFLIDHGSAFAGDSFSPSVDKNAFVPYYLRAWGSNWNSLTSQQKLTAMPVLSKATDNELKAWLSEIHADDVERVLLRYGINPEPSLKRLAKFKGMLDTDNLSEGVNRFWVTG